jgi:hypothetical protein
MVAGVLFGGALVWAGMLFALRRLKDLPLSVDIWARGEAYRESERRGIEAQNHLYGVWRRLWPMALAIAVAGAVLLGVWG